MARRLPPPSVVLKRCATNRSVKGVQVRHHCRVSGSERGGFRPSPIRSILSRVGEMWLQGYRTEEPQ
jgi:hypothetical protein